MYDKPDYRKVRILDQRLEKYGLKRVEVPIDGNCFFHAIVKQIRNQIPSKDTTHWQLRQDCVDYLRINGSIGSKRGEHWSNFLEGEEEDEFLERMGRTGEWADHVMIQVWLFLCHLPGLDGTSSVLSPCPEETGLQHYATNVS